MKNTKQQTAVDLLIEQIKSKSDKLPTNTKENRMAKGIYVDCLLMARQAKEMEKQQIIDFAKWCLNSLLDGEEPQGETIEELFEYFKTNKI